MKFNFKGKKGYWFKVSDEKIVFHRPYKVESCSLYPQERGKIKTFKQAQKVFSWHRSYGLQHRRRHPLGINLYDLTLEHAKNMREVGQPYFAPDPWPDFYEESKKYAIRDNEKLFDDGSLSKIWNNK